MKVRMVCLCLLAMTAIAQADITMHTANTFVGNQKYSAVGLEFAVKTGYQISISQLGIYDSEQNGLSTTLSAVIFDSAKSVVVQQDFTQAAQGTLDGAYRFISLAQPLVLGAGTYTIAGYGFNLDNGAGEHNSNAGGAGPTFNGGGAITFVRSRWTGSGSAVPPAYPEVFYPTSTIDYFDGANMKFAVVPVPGAVALGFMGLGLVGWVKRRMA